MKLVFCLLLLIMTLSLTAQTLTTNPTSDANYRSRLNSDFDHQKQEDFKVLRNDHGGTKESPRKTPEDKVREIEVDSVRKTPSKVQTSP